MAQKEVSMLLKINDSAFKNSLKKIKADLMEIAKLEDKINSKSFVNSPALTQSNKITANLKDQLRYQKEITRLPKAKQSMFGGMRESVGGMSMLGGIGGVAQMAGIYGGIQQMQKLVKMQKDFGTTANLMKVQKNTPEFKQMQNDVFSTATDTKSTVESVLGSMNEALSAGLSNDQSKAIARQAGVVGAGSAVDPAVVTSALVTLTNTFGLASKDLPDIANRMAGLLDVSVGNAQTVISAMPTFLAEGKNLGLGLNEQLAQFSLMTQKGFSPDEAATRTAALFRQMADPSKQMRAAGVNAQTVRTEGLKGVYDRINKYTSGMSEAKKTEWIAKAMPEARAKTALMTGLSGGSGKIAELEAGIKSGDVVANFTRNSDNVSNNLNKLGAEFDRITYNVMESNGGFMSINGMLKTLTTSLQGWEAILKLSAKGWEGIITYFSDGIKKGVDEWIAVGSKIKSIFGIDDSKDKNYKVNDETRPLEKRMEALSDKEGWRDSPNKRIVDMVTSGDLAEGMASGKISGGSANAIIQPLVDKGFDVSEIIAEQVATLKQQQDSTKIIEAAQVTSAEKMANAFITKMNATDFVGPVKMGEKAN